MRRVSGKQGLTQTMYTDSSTVTHSDAYMYLSISFSLSILIIASFQGHSQFFNVTHFSACNIEKLGMGLVMRLISYTSEQVKRVHPRALGSPHYWIQPSFIYIFVIMIFSCNMCIHTYIMVHTMGLATIYNYPYACT